MRRFFKWLLVVVVVVVAALAVNAYIVNGEVQPATADIGRIIDLPGPDLQVQELGPRDAPAIVLLHCYVCSMKWWQPVAQTLSEDHRVIMVDLIGHGGSEKPTSGYEIPNQAKQVFHRFWRGDPSRARTVGGTGLGLAIAMEDANLHGGWLTAWGRPDMGAQFRLTLPRKAGHILETSPLPLVPRDLVDLPLPPLPVETPELPGLDSGTLRAATP